MDIYTDTIRDLGPAEKLQLVEQIWDDLAAEKSPLPLPDWAVTEAARRRDEMLADPNLGSTDEEVWKRISNSRNGLIVTLPSAFRFRCAIGRRLV